MTPSMMASAFVLALIGSVLIVFSRFNTLVRSQKRVQEAWAGIDVQLRQRASLIPNVVEAVRGYAEHEREVVGPIMRALEQIARGDFNVRLTDGMSDNALIGPLATGGASSATSPGTSRWTSIASSFPRGRACSRACRRTAG